jgi:thymidylate kinase
MLVESTELPPQYGRGCRVLVTVSGLDGAGKTTLLNALLAMLEARGRRVVVLTMYDHIAFYSLARRARLVLRRKIEAQPHPPDPRTSAPDRRLLYRIARTDTVRRASFVGDLVLLLAHRVWHERLRGRVLLLDRYVYDSLADVADGRHWGYTRAWIRIAPVPDLPIYVDVDPKTAFARKGEYGVPYLEWRRDIYHRIFAEVPGAVTITNDNFEGARRGVEAALSSRL